MLHFIQLNFHSLKIILTSQGFELIWQKEWWCQDDESGLGACQVWAARQAVENILKVAAMQN